MRARRPANRRVLLGLIHYGRQHRGALSPTAIGELIK